MTRIFGLLSALATFVACAPPPLPAADDSDEDSVAPVEPDPIISILFPESGPDMIYCDKFMVVVDIDNYALNPDIYADNELVEGEGHWHLNVPAGLGGAVVPSGVPYTFVDVSEALPDGGTYAFTAQLVDNLHAPLNDIPVSVVEIIIDPDYDEDQDGTMDCIGGSGNGTGY